jgi:rubrerythrin
MAQITTKELTALTDLLGMEQNLVAKYRAYACQTTDPEMKNEFEQIAQRHQRHYDELYCHLK